MKNLIGQRFGKLVVTGISGKKGGRRECLCDCGEIIVLVKSILTKIDGRKSCGCSRRKAQPLENYIGNKYGHLTIMSVTRDANNVKFFTTKCDCGYINDRNRNITDLINGRTKRCIKCKGLHLSDIYFTGIGDLSRTYFSMIKNIDFNITIEDMWEKYENQNGICNLSGQDLILDRSYGNKNKQTASIDRIDSGKTYTVDNIQWIHKHINCIKGSLNEDEFINFCSLMSKFDKNFIPINDYKEPISVNKNWKGYGEISGSRWYFIKNNARSRAMAFNLNIEDAWDLYLIQGGICALSGVGIHFEEPSEKRSKGNASLDRIDSTKGYTIDNIQWVHKRVNLMKWDFDQDYFIDICKQINKYRGI